ncbi:S8 family serine peptidase [Pseudosporangium ferrugineum]|uniref:Subtilisin family serine protease n=1 Tax=Pseudosporangium ferrugineum TaxID=439699 RepID=A0A2T0RJP8_9ACTN|nr:S8 family serine peptidase [Pseudosporangium ferrugineum]PRY21347.1 subtilisin family serine protease [Pseudosporangium ferrugineum]
MRPRRVSAALIAAVTALAVGAVAPAAAHAAPPVPAARAVPVSVTLITGDTVTVDDRGGLSLQRAPGRERVPFLSRTSGEHRYVIPADALPLVRAGRLDQRLFDLTALRDFGYTGDADLPLLVAYPESGRRKGSSGVRSALGATVRVARDLPAVGALAVRAPRSARAGLWTSLSTGTPTARTLRPGIERVHLDGKRKINLDVSVPQVGAPAAWAEGLDGTGVTVAVLDTGIDATHPDFAGRIVASENFTADPDADDVVGHGTHVASTIAGSGAKSGGRYKGVAPGAKLAVGKVCELDGCPDSAILAGMEWAAREAPVVNISIGGTDEPGLDPLEQAVNDLTAKYGALFVISAGNDGGTATIESPGSADAALTVGAVDDQDQLAYFSSRGPRVGDDALKPDLTAPGVGIVAAAAAHGQVGSPADGYVSLDGTSMATPHVAGAAAIVTQQHPGWSPARRKSLLMGAAKPTAGLGGYAQGAGRLDVDRAVHQAVSVDEGSVSFGRAAWPHADDVPVSRTITYRNAGAEDVALSLALEAEGSTFSLGAAGLTVPAGGTATTTVTADTRADGPYGLLSGRVVATGPGGVRVETPIAVNRESEVYDVTFQHVGRDGEDALDYLTALRSLTGGPSFDSFGGTASTTVRVPKGEYGMFSWIYGEDDVSMLVQPKLVVDRPQTIKLDARRAGPVSITPPVTDAGQALLAVNIIWSGEFFGTNATMVGAEGVGAYVGQVGDDGDPDRFAASINSVYARPDGAGGYSGTPYTYEASYGRRGAFYDGFVKKLRRGEMARIDGSYRQEAAGDTVTGFKWNKPNAGPAPSWSVGFPTQTPFRRTEWLSTDDGVLWSGQFVQMVRPPNSFPSFLSSSGVPDARFEAGRGYRQEWNVAGFAPSMAGDSRGAWRSGDYLVAGVPLFSEGTGALGSSAVEKARTALYSDGELIGEQAGSLAQFEVPAAAAPYRLEMSASRGAPHRLSTSVSASWTFTSGTGDYVLPLSTVRFHPRLDDHNAAPAGGFAVPVTVERPADSTAGPNRTFSAEFSTDDGASWQPAPVTGAGDHRTIRVTNAPGGAVSLRVHAIDRAGNTATITVVRAYAVRG